MDEGSASSGKIRCKHSATGMGEGTGYTVGALETDRGRGWGKRRGRAQKPSFVLRGGGEMRDTSP